MSMDDAPEDSTHMAIDAELNALADNLLQEFSPQGDAETRLGMMLEPQPAGEPLDTSAAVAVTHPNEGASGHAASMIHTEMISLLDKDEEISPKLAQQILHARAELTASTLMVELPGIEVQPAGANAHFLIHKDKSTVRPSINPSGPQTGFLHPGDEGAYPKRAMLKVSGTGEGKAPGQTVSVWREVRSMHADILHSPIQKPVKLKDFEDLDPKVSLVTSRVSNSGNKRQRRPEASSSTGVEGTGACPDMDVQRNLAVGGSCNVSGSAQVCGVAQVAGDATIGGDATINGNARIGGSASIGVDLCVGRDLTVNGQLHGEVFRSPAGDFAEWFRRADEAEPIGEGDVVLMHGNSITRKGHLEGELPSACYFVVSTKPCLLGYVPPTATEFAKGNPVAFIGRVDVRVVGPAPVGAKLVPSGHNDGTALALPLDEAAGSEMRHVLGIVVGASETPGCVLALVMRGLTADSTLAEVLERLNHLQSRVERLEGVLAKVLALSDVSDMNADPAKLARRLAWRVGCTRTTESTTDRTLVDLGPDGADGVVSALLATRGHLSLAGTLLVMLGWAVHLDAGTDSAKGSSASKGMADRQHAAEHIFARLEETSASYQRMMWVRMSQLPWALVEQLANCALEVAREEKAAASSTATTHSAGRHYYDLLGRELVKKRAQGATPTTITAPPTARAYQEELVERVGEKNAIVVCKTGAGKTLVSAMVIEQVIARSTAGGGERLMVIYLEKTRHLVEQEKQKLCTYFKSKGFDGEFIGHYIGGELMPAWHLLMQRHTILVMTVDLFLRRLQIGEAKVADCGLIVFDECHSTSGGHSYNKVNQEIRRFADTDAAARGSGRERVPQILGLTATPTWKDTVEQNMAALALLCHNMNNATLVQVIDHKDDLHRFVHEPTQTVHPLQPRPLDQQYKSLLPEVMSTLEGILSVPFGYEVDVAGAMREVAAALAKDRHASTGFSKNYERLVREKLREQTFESCGLARVVLQLLLSLNSADATTDEVGFESAQCLLGSMIFQCVELAAGSDVDERDACLEVIKSVLESSLCQERFVHPLLDAHPLTARGTERNCSPKLAELVRCLEPYAEEELPLRGIVYVETRASAHRVVNFIQMHPRLRHFVRPVVFCGHAEMSSRAQENVRQAFELGKFNLLVSTSVGEEGLNVTAMNIAVLLDSVTSGRAHDQTKGRVMRMAGGAFHIFYYQESREANSMWRAKQQREAAQDALSEVARVGRTTGNQTAFADLQIGPNPLVRMHHELNHLKMSGVIDGPKESVTEKPNANGLFEAVVKLVTLQTTPSRDLEAMASATTKKGAIAKAKEALLNKYLRMGSDADLGCSDTAAALPSSVPPLPT